MRVVFATLALLCVAANAHAALPPGWRNLALTDAQQAQLKAIQASYTDQINALKDQQYYAMCQVLSPQQRQQLAQATMGAQPLAPAATQTAKLQQQQILKALRRIQAAQRINARTGRMH